MRAQAANLATKIIPTPLFSRFERALASLRPFVPIFVSAKSVADENIKKETWRVYGQNKF